MIDSSFVSRGIAAAFVVFQLAGCGGAEPSDEQLAEDESAAVEGSQGSRAVDGDPAATGSPESDAGSVEQPFVLTAMDLTAYERGLRREVELLASAQERLRQAQDGEQQLEILGEVQPQELRREGAAAAGLPAERYEAIASAIEDVLGKLDMGETMRQMMPSAADLAAMSPEQRAQVEENARQMQAAWGDPYEGLDAATADALEVRSAELRQLRAERTGLLFSVAQ